MNKNPNPEKIGQKIRLLRELKRITREKMADDLKMSLSGYSKIERDQIGITVERASQIAEALGISLAKLICFNEDHIFSNSTIKQDAPIDYADIFDKKSQEELIVFLKIQLEEKNNLILSLLKKTHISL